MKPYQQILAVFLIVFVPGAAFAGQFKITRIRTGDTVAIESHHLRIEVRLAGINAPAISRNENGMANPYGQQAKRFLSGLILNRFVNLRRFGRSLDGRILAVIYTGTTNINLEMIKAGLAEADKRNLPKGFDITPYLKAETAARKAMLGMWSRRRSPVETVR